MKDDFLFSPWILAFLFQALCVLFSLLLPGSSGHQSKGLQLLSRPVFWCFSFYCFWFSSEEGEGGSSPFGFLQGSIQGNPHMLSNKKQDETLNVFEIWQCSNERLETRKFTSVLQALDTTLGSQKLLLTWWTTLTSSLFLNRWCTSHANVIFLNITCRRSSSNGDVIPISIEVDITWWHTLALFHEYILKFQKLNAWRGFVGLHVGVGSLPLLMPLQ